MTPKQFLERMKQIETAKLEVMRLIEARDILGALSAATNVMNLQTFLVSDLVNLIIGDDDQKPSSNKFSIN